MSLIDLLSKEVRLGKADCCKCRIIGMVCGAPEVRRLDERSVLFEEALVIAKVIRIYLEEIADER